MASTTYKGWIIEYVDGSHRVNGKKFNSIVTAMNYVDTLQPKTS